MGLIARTTRSSLLEVLAADYVRTARSKGLSEGLVVGLHALRNALIPVVTVIGLTFASLLSGAVLTETVFAWPGIGRYAVTASTRLDYPAILGVTMVTAVIYITVNLVVDLLVRGPRPAHPRPVRTRHVQRRSRSPSRDIVDGLAATPVRGRRRANTALRWGSFVVGLWVFVAAFAPLARAATAPWTWTS